MFKSTERFKHAYHLSCVQIMDEDRKAVKSEAGAPDSSVLNIKVKDQAGGEMVFKVKMHTRFQKILDSFCKKKAVDPAQVRLVFDGQRINTTSCPDELGMEDGDTIDAFLEQVGGAF